jgi:hypothetical protein
VALPDLDLGELGDAWLTLDEAERLMFESREVGAVQHCPEPVAPAHGADVDHARSSARGVPTLARPGDGLRKIRPRWMPLEPRVPRMTRRSTLSAADDDGEHVMWGNSAEIPLQHQEDHVVWYEIDPAHTNVGFSAKHLAMSTVRGQFQQVRRLI